MRPCHKPHWSLMYGQREMYRLMVDTDLGKRIQVDLWNLHLRQNTGINCHGCFEDSTGGIPLMMQSLPWLFAQAIDWYLGSWQPPFLLLSLTRIPWTLAVVFLSHSNSTINIPKLCFMEAVQSVLAAWDTLQKVWTSQSLCDLMGHLKESMSRNEKFPSF